MHHYSYKLAQNPFSIYAFCETWFSESIADNELTFGDKFQSFRADRLGRIGGGVLLLVPKCFPAFQIGGSVSNPSFEAVAAKVHIQRTCIAVIVCYRPPPANDDNFLPLWSNYLSSLPIQNLPTLIFGDFNFPDICWQTLTAPGNSTQPQFLNFCITNGFDQSVLDEVSGFLQISLYFQVQEKAEVDQKFLRKRNGFSVAA